MLISCSYCGGVHERGEVCPKKPARIKPNTRENKFRWSKKWINKREHIRDRDTYLCQVCKRDHIYTCEDLEVHHIEKLVERWDLRLEDSNLITLCAECHKKADRNIISKDYLRDIVKLQEKI